MSLAARYACPGCSRRFLSERARSRHRAHNPDHWLGSRSPGTGEWVAFPETLETFRALPEGTGATDLTVTHDADAEVVHIEGAHEERLEAPPVAGGFSWTVRGGFLLLSFERPGTD